MKNKIIVFASVFVFLFCSVSMAAVITFDELPTGVWDGLSYQSLGVTFSAEKDNYSYANLLVRDLISSSFPDGNVLSTDPVDSQYIIATFSDVTDFVQIENVICGLYTSEIDIITATAYDINGVALGTITQNSGDQFLTFNVAGIKSVKFNDADISGYVIDNFTWNAVPEPATMLLLGLGLVGLAGARRKMQR